jgi:hypothetical protein
MKIITKTYEVYSFDELNEESQNRVIDSTIRMVLDLPFMLTENMKNAIRKADAMQTPWFTEEYIRDYAEEDIMVIVNDYEYLKNGEVFIED